MMKFIKKVISAILAGAVMTASVFAASVSSSAAQSAKLISMPLSSLNSSAISIESIGQDLYLMRLADGGKSVYKIDSSNISKLQSTGKLSAKKVVVDQRYSDTPWELDPNYTFKYGNYGMINISYKSGLNGRVAVKYDEAANTIRYFYKSDEFFTVTSDGYICEYVTDRQNSKDMLTLTLTTKSPELIKYGENYFNYIRASGQFQPFMRGSKYAVVTYNFNYNGKSESALYLVDKAADRYNIYNKGIVAMPVVGYNYVAFEHAPLGTMEVRNLGSNITRTIRKATSYYDKSGNRYDLYDFGDKIYGDRAIGIFRNEIGKGEYRYTSALVDLKNDKILTGALAEITTDDGKIFTGRTMSGKYFYYDSNGKKLTDVYYDAAGNFAKGSDYAPVIKDGKLVLVDRNIKTASDAISVSGDNVRAATLASGLYSYVSEGRSYLLTYKGGSKSASASDSSATKPGKTTLSVKKDGTSLTFSWKAVSGAGKYEIYYSTDNGKTTKKLATVSGSKTSCTITVKSGSSARFAIRAVNTANGKTYNGDLSAWTAAK